MALAQREQDLAAQRLGLERYRVEFLARSANPAASEKRVEKVTRKAAARVVAAQRDLTKQRGLLAAEATRLDERARAPAALAG